MKASAPSSTPHPDAGSDQPSPSVSGQPQRSPFGEPVELPATFVQLSPWKPLNSLPKPS